MKYPDSVIAAGSKGKKEARVLVERGEYVRYTYVDPETDKPIKEGKETVILRNHLGEYEKLFIVPISGGKNFVFRKRDVDVKAKVWDKNEKKDKNLF
jgi:hypothetical protein